MSDAEEPQNELHESTQRRQAAPIAWDNDMLTCLDHGSRELVIFRLEVTIRAKPRWQVRVLCGPCMGTRRGMNLDDVAPAPITPDEP